MSMVDELATFRRRADLASAELAEARATIAALRHQLGEAHKRHKAMADALAVRADETQRLEYELRRARADEAKLADHYQEVGAFWHQACVRAEAAEARVTELEAERYAERTGRRVVDEHIEAAAEALRSEQRYMTDSPEALARVAVRAWLASVGIDSRHLDEIVPVYFLTMYQNTGGMEKHIREWASAVRAVEPTTNLDQWETNGGSVD